MAEMNKTAIIKNVELVLERQQVTRGLKFVVTLLPTDGNERKLTYDVVEVGAKFTYTAFSWRYPKVYDGFCQLCDLMALLHVETLDDMVGEVIRIKENDDGVTVISDKNGKHVCYYKEGIEAGAHTGCVSGLGLETNVG